MTQVICCPLDALGTTVATYGGQNIGAKKLDRISKGMRTCVAFGLIYSVIAFFLIKYFGPTLLSLFIGAEETSVLADAQYFIMHWVAFCAPLTFVYVFRFMIQGLGFSKLAVFAGVFEMLARGLISLFWIPAAGFEAVCLFETSMVIAPTFFWFRPICGCGRSCTGNLALRLTEAVFKQLLQIFPRPVSAGRAQYDGNEGAPVLLGRADVAEARPGGIAAFDSRRIGQI